MYSNSSSSGLSTAADPKAMPKPPTLKAPRHRRRIAKHRKPWPTKFLKKEEAWQAQIQQSGSDTDSQTSRPAIEMVASCPDLIEMATSSWYEVPSPRFSHEERGRRISRSQPPTPTVRSRLRLRFRGTRAWKSARNTNFSTRKASIVEIPGWKDAKERRRMARGSEEPHSLDESLDAVGPGLRVEDGTSPLALATVIVATGELDRLSQLARQNEEQRWVP